MKPRLGKPFDRNLGWTWIEALVVLAVLTLLTTWTWPALDRLRTQSAGQALVQALRSSIAQARHTAIYSQQLTVLCPSAQGQVCEPRARWEEGWIVFIDTNRNGQRDPEETIVRVQQPSAHGWRIQGNTPVSASVNYAPSGKSILLHGAFQAGTFTLCHDRWPELRQQIVINRAGRPRHQASPTISCTP